MVSCGALETIYYEGSEKDWKKIGVESSNAPFKAAKVEYNCAPFNPGDANGDGDINSRDVILVMKAALPGFKAPADYVAKAADIVEDGEINSRDVIEVMKAALANA